MKWSFRIGRVWGIDLRIHATFLILVAWIALVYYRTSGSMAGAIQGVAFILALFACVVLHELGHALAARQVGVPTRDITLLPIGGVARLEFMPEKPRHELWIAIAGPLVTAVIAAVLYAIVRTTAAPELDTPAGEVLERGARGGMLSQLMWVNLWLLGFNLLPAFPMDGGRVLRAILAMRMNFARATEVASRIGRGFALLFGIIGLMYNPFLVLIALFVWMGAAGESASIQLRSALGGIPVSAVMVREFRSVSPSDSLSVVLSHIIAGFQQDFPVVDGGKPVGFLTQASLVDAVAKRGKEVSVGDVMAHEIETIGPDEPADRALARLQARQTRALLVTANGSLVGMFTPDNVGEFVMIGAALEGRAPRV